MVLAINCIRRLLPIPLLVVLSLAPFVPFLEAKLGESQVKNRNLKTFEEKLRSEYPFDRCQGDCDVDEDCKGNLICFQRKGYEPVPGCRGGENDRTSTDYCIDLSYFGSSDNENNLPMLKYLGRNPGPNDYPLQECEGDCDKNSDCAAGLVCLQRRHENSGPVPGCRGRDDSLTDYCVQSSFLVHFDEKAEFPVSKPSKGKEPRDAKRPPDSTRKTSPPKKSYEMIEDFGLKMYWEPHYMWQEENFDRRWCMECMDGKCDYGDKTYIHTCERAISQRYDFISINDNDTMIRLHGTNLCFERILLDIFLYECDLRNPRQLWVGDFRADRFEIKPSGLLSHCVTQRHHPKFYEEVEIETCRTARSSHTSYWTRY